MMRIGSAHIETHIFFAPLSGCSDLAFRLIAREHGAKFCFFEMIDAHSLLGPHRKTVEMLHTVKEDAPTAAQLVGESAELLRDAAHILLEQVQIPFLDINCACPVKKVIKKKAGAWLVTSPDTLSGMISTLASSLSIPITVKLRAGYHSIDLHALEYLVKTCEGSGASAIFIHGRTRDQGYSGSVNYEAVRTVKQSVAIPVLGSGDVFDPQSARKMFRETACDGILVARGAFGNPWIFQDIENYLHHDILPQEKSLAEKKAVLLRHLAYVARYKQSVSPRGSIGFMRKIALWYLKGFPNASKIRRHITTVADYDSLREFIESIPSVETRSGCSEY